MSAIFRTRRANLHSTDKSSFHLSKFDQMRTTHSTQRRSKKWWMPLFAWWIDAMCVKLDASGESSFQRHS